MMRTENWCGFNIRFVEVDGEWWAILKDICDALRLRTKDISQRLDPDMMLGVRVETERKRPKKYKENYDMGSKGVVISKDGSNDVRSCDHYSKGIRSRGQNKTRWMLAVNEIGIYEALFASRRLEARKFRRWSAEVMKKLRTNVGLEGYEVMKMTEPAVQEKIDWILDTLFLDPDTGILMRSVTVAGGDVEQVPFI